jgi:hypothetical protein
VTRRPPRRDGSQKTGRRRLLAGLATGIAGVGIGVNVLESTAYTSAVADRPSNAAVADDPNAVLGMEGLTDTSVTPTFTNHADASMTVTLDADRSEIDWDLGDDGTWKEKDVTFDLSSSESREVAIRGGDDATVDVMAVLSSGGVDTGRIALQRTIDIPQSSAVKEIQGSASSAGNSGNYEFELENTGDIDVTLVGVGIKETTNPDAVVVEGDNPLSGGGQQLVSSPIPVDSSNPNQDTRVDFDQDFRLDAGVTELFEFKRFQRSDDVKGGPPHADMRGEDVKATFYFSDGSSGVVELCINGCDF